MYIVTCIWIVIIIHYLQSWSLYELISKLCRSKSWITLTLWGKLIEWANQQILLFITYCYPSGEIFHFLIEFNSQVLNFPCRYSIMCTSECSHFGLPVHVTQSFLKHFEEGEMFIVYICLTHVKCQWNQFKSGQSISWCIST